MFCNYRWIWQQNAFSSCLKFLVNVGKRIEFVRSRREINSFINVNGNALSNQMAKYLSHWNVNYVVSQLVRYTFVGIVECDAKIIKSSRIMNNERMCIRCFSERIWVRPTGIAQIGMRRAWAKRETYFFYLLLSRLMNILRQRNFLFLRCQCAFVAIKREQLPNIHTLIKTIIHTINDTSNTRWGRFSYIPLEKMHNFYFNWIWVWALSWFSFQLWNGELCMLDAEEAHYWHEDVCMTIVQNAQWKG